MTLAEVEAILGPPGDYRSGPTGFHGAQILEEPDERRFQKRDWSWESDHGFLRVYPSRDDENRVAGAWFMGWDSVEQTPRQNLLWRAKRLWRRWFPE
jgi:hypothetical protein